MSLRRSIIALLHRIPGYRAASLRWGRAYWRLPRVFRQRLMYSRQLAKASGVAIYTYRGPEFVRPDPPRDLPTLGHRLAATPYHLKPAFVAELPSAWLVGKHAAVVTNEGRLLLSAFREQPGMLGLEANEDLQRWLSGRGWKKPPVASHWDCVFPMVSRLDANYFHWITESCGMLAGIEEYERQTGRKPKLLIRAGGAPYIRASLEMLGYGSRIVEWTPAAQPELATRVLIGTLPGSGFAESPANVRWLRQRFLHAAGIDPAHVVPSRLLYIPRKKGGWRSIANAAEIQNLLTERGFEAVAAEKMEFLDQVRLFSEAKMIVRMHGAGLTNVLFAATAMVVEVLGAYGGGEYYSIAQSLGHPYQSVRCGEINSNGDVVVGPVQRECLRQSLDSADGRIMPIRLSEVANQAARPEAI